MDPSIIDGPAMEEACVHISEKMSELEVAVGEIHTMLETVGQLKIQFDGDHFERADKFRQELVAHLKDHMLTLQVAEERRQELQRAIEEGETLRHHFRSQKGGRTKTALLTQWKSLEDVRANLKRRFQSLASLPGQVLKTSSSDDEVVRLERSLSQKSRVVDILAQRLKGSADLSEAEKELLALASSIKSA